MKTLSFSTLWSNGFMMVIVASSSFTNVQRSRYWLCFQIVVGRNVQHRIVVGEVCRCHCKGPCSGDCELETAADCTSTGCSPSKLLTACQLHALHHWVLKNATEKDWNTDCSFPLTDAAAGAIAPVRVATANCAKARLTCCRGQGFVLHGFLCSLFSCACWCACVVVVGVVAWPVVSANVSPLLWMCCLCVCAVLELTSIVLPGSLLRYHVKFHCSTCLSISSIVTAQLCDHSYCIVLSLWAQVCKGSRPCDPGIVHGHYCMCIVHMVQWHCS
jgi:hypothetical protein